MSRRSRRGASRRNGAGAEIDMNSMIDLTFLLLVTFMVTIPALEQGIDVLLPRGKANKIEKRETKPNVVTVDAKNMIFFNDSSPITLAELEQRLREKVAADPECPVLVRGDERINYGGVMDVVKTLYKCKVRRMSLVTVDKP